MENFVDDIKLAEWFGDFGGNVSVNDASFETNNELGKLLEKFLSAPEFHSKFQEILKMLVIDEIELKKFTLKNGINIVLAPSLSKYYNIAGQLALAKIMGRSKIFVGSKSEKILRILGKTCKELGFSLSVILGRNLCSDTDLISYLQSMGCEVDSTTCVKLFDLPHEYIEKPDAGPFREFVLWLDANYGSFPRPALVGSLASLYGRELKNLLSEDPECITVPVTSGIEAIGVFKPYLNEKTKLVTVEKPISQEFHMMDQGAYSLSTRSADSDEMNTTLCPELVNWWRMGKVIRLGCDRIKLIDTSELEQLGLSKETARAVALTVEAIDCKNFLALESE